MRTAALLHTPGDPDFHWLIGLLEGEGCFTRCRSRKWDHPRVSILMTDEDVIRRAASLLGVTSVYQNQPKNKKHSKNYRVVVTGHRATDLMRAVLPYMGTRRTRRIAELLQWWDAREGICSRGCVCRRHTA